MAERTREGVTIVERREIDCSCAHLPPKNELRYIRASLYSDEIEHQILRKKSPTFYRKEKMGTL
jgi:hypothetical protein